MSMGNPKKRKSRFSEAPALLNNKRPRGGGGAGVDAAAAAAAMKAAEITRALAGLTGGGPPPPEMSIQSQIAADIARAQASLLLNNNSNKALAQQPQALLLDAQGREVDALGNLVVTEGPQKTTLVNRAKPSNPYLAHIVVGDDGGDEATGTGTGGSIDPRLKVTDRSRREKRAFAFFEPGTHIKKADAMRAKEARKMLSGLSSGRNPNAYRKRGIANIGGDGDGDGEDVGALVAVAPKPGLSGTAVDVAADAMNGGGGVPSHPEDSVAVPDMEWWDAVALLPRGGREARVKAAAQGRGGPDAVVACYADAELSNCKTAGLVQHPPPLKPIFVKPAAKPVPLMLTKAERKRIRRKARLERERDKQDEIRAGLRDAPEPKLKLSNMYKVLADSAVADPSKVETMVRKQMEQRVMNHEMRNQARKLTPLERKEKHKRKLEEDTSREIQVALFRVTDLSGPKHRFKVDVNAQQLALTGGVLMCREPSEAWPETGPESGLSLVVVEGGPKAVRKFTKLMLKRIKWSGDDYDDDGDEDDDDDDDAMDGTGNSSTVKRCDLVWQGVVLKRSFNNFRFQECRTSATARKVMEAKGVAQYWDMVLARSGTD